MPQPQQAGRGGPPYKSGNQRDLEAGTGGNLNEVSTADAGRVKSSSARHLRSASETTAGSRRRASSIGASIIGSQQAGHGDFKAPLPQSLATAVHKPSRLVERCLEQGTQVLMLLTVIALLTGGLAGFKYVHEHTADRPTQIHLAQGVDPTEMTVSFVTQKGSAPYVQYGTSDKALNQRSPSSAAVTTQYSFVSYTYQNYSSPRLHHVKLKDLKPDTGYYYVLRDEREPLVSPVLQFRTMPAVGSHPSPLSFGVLADLGTSNDSASTIQHVVDNTDLRMILHPGDLSYADCRGHLWDTYGEMTQPVASSRPWMVGAGNHEIEQQPGTSDLYVAFENRYRMPWVKPAQFGDILLQSYEEGTTNRKRCDPSVFLSYYDYGNSFFSFSAGLVHVIYLNPYTPTDPSSRQYQWLSQDLSALDRSLTPWVLVLTHCPLYSSNAVHYAEVQTIRMRAHMEPLFYQHKVNLVITGHVHAYERTHPVYLNQTLDDGVVYVTIGDGGNYEGHAAKYWPQPSWSSFRNGTQYGHASYTVLNTTHSLWQWHRNLDGAKVTRDEAYVCNAITHGRTVC